MPTMQHLVVEFELLFLIFMHCQCVFNKKCVVAKVLLFEQAF